MTAWVVVMKDELEEQEIKLIEIENKQILMIKKEGNIHAVDNSCPHMGCPLKSGILEGYTLKCGCHNWGFDIRTGKNVDTGEYIDMDDPNIDVYETQIVDGNISVKI